MPKNSKARWQKLFDPRSVAVIGATPEARKVGFALMANLLRGKKRDLYPVSVTQAEILDLKAYRSVLAVEAPIDLAVVAVRADIVPQVLIDCGHKRVPFVIIISAGFKEAGEEGKKLEAQVAAIAKKYRISLVGPNCLGVMDGDSDLNASFAVEKPLPGDIAFVSQSGALGTALLDWANAHSVGFSKFVSLGNEAGLTELDFLEYLAEDPKTKAIILYLEHIKDGPKFMAVASRITKTKPVVVIKAGRSSRGRAAVASHTGSLAPADAVFTAACRASGIIVIDSLRDLFNLARLFRLGVRRPLRRLVVLTNGGGPSIVAADAIDSSPLLNLAELSETTKRRLRAVLPPMAAVGNPVDIIGDADASRYEDALNILTAEKDIDAILVMLTPQMMTEIDKTADLLLRFAQKKTILPVFMGGRSIQKGVAKLEYGGLGNFWFPEDVIRGLEAMAAGRGSKKPSSKVPPAEARPPKMMDHQAMVRLLGRYGIRLDGIFLGSLKGLAAAVRKLGNGPFALKVVSPDIVHKTDTGGVALDLADRAAAEAAWEGIVRSVKRKNRKARIQGMVLQKMGNGREIIIGMKRDPVFGPAVIFGLGGIFVEAMKDSSLRIAPVDGKTAREMFQEIKGAPLLRGLRGERPVSFAAIEKLVVSISRLAMANPKVVEIDLNPVMATEKGSVVVDARILLRD